MGWFRVDRSRRPDGDRFLYPKMASFGAGAVLAVLGMSLERDWLVDAAIVLLALGILLRFVRRDESPKE